MFAVVCGVGGAPLVELNVSHFPRDTSCRTSAVGKIDVSNVKTFTFILVYLIGDLPPRQCSQRSYESMPLFVLFI